MKRLLKSGIVIAIGILVVTFIVQSLFVSDAYAYRIANGNGTMDFG